MKINVLGIWSTWRTCDYKLMVKVEDAWMNHEYIIETLCQWFGTAKYWGDGWFLCSIK